MLRDYLIRYSYGCSSKIREGRHANLDPYIHCSLHCPNAWNCARTGESPKVRGGSTYKALRFVKQQGALLDTPTRGSHSTFSHEAKIQPLSRDTSQSTTSAGTNYSYSILALNKRNSFHITIICLI